jgi:hypothetical protein
VPANTWKAIVVLPLGDNDLARITTATRVIAVRVPNIRGLSTEPWPSYVISADSIEGITGYDLLANVPPAVQRVIEARVDGTSPAATIAATTPITGSASVGAAFAAPLAVRALDADGKPVAGVPIVFADLGDTAQAIFAGGDTQVTVITDADGVARTPTLSANLLAGAHTIEASTTGIYEPVRFTLTNTPVDAPPGTQVFLPLVVR